MATWRAENSMLTQRGVEILNKLKAGVGSITVTRIVAGSGRVTESLLYPLTNVKGVQKEMTISSVNTSSDGSEISFYITNDTFTESYDLHQLGVYVTHPDYEGEQLYHISQCDADDFDTIPAMGETPVSQGYSIFMEHGNSSAINLTVDPQGMVRKDEFDEFKRNTVPTGLAYEYKQAKTKESLISTIIGWINSMPERHIRNYVLNAGAEGLPLEGGVWFLTINKASATHSSIVAIRYDASGALVKASSYMNGTLTGWSSFTTTSIVPATVE